MGRQRVQSEPEVKRGAVSPAVQPVVPRLVKLLLDRAAHALALGEVGLRIEQEGAQARERNGFRVGDRVVFSHFGSDDRPGRIAKIAKSALLIEWTAPSSGKTRTVRVGLHPILSGGQIYPAQVSSKNVRVQREG